MVLLFKSSNNKKIILSRNEINNECYLRVSLVGSELFYKKNYIRKCIYTFYIVFLFKSTSTYIEILLKNCFMFGVE